MELRLRCNSDSINRLRHESINNFTDVHIHSKPNQNVCDSLQTLLQVIINRCLFPAIKELHIQGSIRKQDLKQISSLVTHRPSLKTISLSTINPTPLLLQEWLQTTTVTGLNISSPLFPEISPSQPLERFSFIGICDQQPTINSENINFIFHNLINCRLFSLTLGSVFFSPGVFTALIQTINDSNSLQKLKLSLMSIDADAIAIMLSSNQTITTLDLSYSLIPVENLYKIIMALKNNTTVKKFKASLPPLSTENNILRIKQSLQLVREHNSTLHTVTVTGLNLNPYSQATR